jgi:hypothetical protein
LKILAIDPGSKESAFVVWDGFNISCKGKILNSEMLSVIHEAHCESPADVSHVAIEQIVGSYGGNAGLEVMDTAYWSGRFAECWANRRGEQGLIRLPRKTVVTHVCGQSRANDSNVRCALIDRVGGQGTKKQPGPTFGVSKDIWAALAVAVCAHDRLTCGIEQASLLPVGVGVETR